MKKALSIRLLRLVGPVVLIVAFAAATVLLVAGESRGAGNAASPMPTWLNDYVKAAATSFGDTQPTSISWTLTTAAVLQHAASDGAAPETPPAGTTTMPDKQLYVVVLHGKFVDYGARLLTSSMAPPDGDTLVVVFDAQTHEGTSYGIGYEPSVINAALLGGLAPATLP